jgi:hypothetical protein
MLLCLQYLFWEVEVVEVETKVEEGEVEVAEVEMRVEEGEVDLEVEGEAKKMERVEGERVAKLKLNLTSY